MFCFLIMVCKYKPSNIAGKQPPSASQMAKTLTDHRRYLKPCRPLGSTSIPPHPDDLRPGRRVVHHPGAPPANQSAAPWLLRPAGTPSGAARWRPWLTCPQVCLFGPWTCIRLVVPAKPSLIGNTPVSRVVRVT